MKRRNFLEGILAIYACATSYFTFRFLKNKKDDDKNFAKYNISNENEKKIGVIELPIVYHCNLNCAYCDHFAPIAPEYQIAPEVLSKHLKKLYEITKGKVGTFCILGGEPLLHKKLCEIIETINKIFPKSNISITTNGLLINNQSDKFWQICRKYNVLIMVENYILNDETIDFNKVYEKLKKYNCNLHINTPKYKFRQTSLTKEKQQNKTNRFSRCNSKNWAIFDDGKFYPCPTVNGVEKFFNKKFPQYAIPVSGNDILDIYKISTLDEIIDFYNKPKEMCAHCGKHLQQKWCKSSREAKEWYNI